MKKIIYFIIFIFYTCMVIAVIPQNQTAQIILRNQTTGTVLNGTETVTYSIRRLTDNMIIWNETITKDLNKGIFSVLLGNTNALNYTYFLDYYQWELNSSRGWKQNYTGTPQDLARVAEFALNVNWQNISNVPSDISDGDDDTLYDFNTTVFYVYNGKNVTINLTYLNSLYALNSSIPTHLSNLSQDIDYYTGTQVNISVPVLMDNGSIVRYGINLNQTINNSIIQKVTQSYITSLSFYSITQVNALNGTWNAALLDGQLPSYYLDDTTINGSILESNQYNTTQFNEDDGILNIVTSWLFGLFYTKEETTAFNETSYIDAVNTTSNIEELGFTQGAHTVDTTIGNCSGANCDIGWRNITSVPAGFADDVDNDTLYTHLSNFTNDLSISGGNDGLFYNYTPIKTTGNITNGSLVGYPAGNSLCAHFYPLTHMCTMDEVINTINVNKSNQNFTATFRVSEGAPGYLAEAYDCSGWTNDDGAALGSIFVGSRTHLNTYGTGSLVACNAQRAIGCCG